MQRIQLGRWRFIPSRRLNLASIIIISIAATTHLILSIRTWDSTFSNANYQATNQPSRKLSQWGWRSSTALEDPEKQKKVIAFFFPQFHEVEENNQFWGKGFTDFSNVVKLKYNRNGQSVLRPSERMGFYDLTSKEQRRFQGELAKAYDIHGFAIYHYWFGKNPVMSKPLELMLEEGHPDIPICLSWANEPWTRRWDGMDGSEVLLNQTYYESDWLPHFKWLLPFFKHINYIRYKGMPIFLIYRASHIVNREKMLSTWQQWARESGLSGIHFIQTFGGKWTSDDHTVLAGMDSAIEFHPIYKPTLNMNEVLAKHEDFSYPHFFGTSCAWDNSPRHAKDLNAASITLNHPKVLYFWLRQNLARTEPGRFVLLNAWNEWGEGAAIEPSIQWGRRWLQAVQHAVKDEKAGHVAEMLPDGFVKALPLTTSGVQQDSRNESVCIIIRTFRGHATGKFNVHQTISSLLKLNHRNFKAFLVDTDEPSFSSLQYIIDGYDHGGRIQISPVSYGHQIHYTSIGAYEKTDWAIREHCMSNSFEWMLITNGDNWYAQDALDYLPIEYDLVLMNFYSRHSVITAVELTQGDKKDLCCIRLNDFQCSVSEPKTGLVDLGAIIIRTDKFKQQNLSFQMTNAKSEKKCGIKFGGCHDGVLVEHMVANGWSYVRHPINVCAFYHNSNPLSCEMIGGVWLDVVDRERAGCYYWGDVPIDLADVKYDNFYASEKACLC